MRKLQLCWVRVVGPGRCASEQPPVVSAARCASHSSLLSSSRAQRCLGSVGGRRVRDESPCCRVVWSALRIGPRATNDETGHLESEEIQSKKSAGGQKKMRAADSLGRSLAKRYHSCVFVACAVGFDDLVEGGQLIQVEPNNTEHGVQCLLWLGCRMHWKGGTPSRLSTMSSSNLSPVICVRAAQGLHRGRACARWRWLAVGAVAKAKGRDPRLAPSGTQFGMQ